jgi:hypothetical protein
MYEKALDTNNEEINKVVFKETVQQFLNLL